MDQPSQLFNRVRRRKARPALRQNGRDAVAPAPIQPSAPSMKPTADASRPTAAPQPMFGPPAQPAAPAERPAAPTPALRRPPGSHALYSQIMRSHDRMGTRHL